MATFDHPVFQCDLNAGIRVMAARISQRGTRQNNWPNARHQAAFLSVLDAMAKRAQDADFGFDPRPLQEVLTTPSSAPEVPQHEAIMGLAEIMLAEKHHGIQEPRNADTVAIERTIAAMHLALTDSLPRMGLDGKGKPCIVGCDHCKEKDQKQDWESVAPRMIAEAGARGHLFPWYEPRELRRPVWADEPKFTPDQTLLYAYGKDEHEAPPFFYRSLEIAEADRLQMVERREQPHLFIATIEGKDLASMRLPMSMTLRSDRPWYRLPDYQQAERTNHIPCARGRCGPDVPYVEVRLTEKERSLWAISERIPLQEYLERAIEFRDPYEIRGPLDTNERPLFEYDQLPWRTNVGDWLTETESKLRSDSRFSSMMESVDAHRTTAKSWIGREGGASNPGRRLSTYTVTVRTASGLEGKFAEHAFTEGAARAMAVIDAAREQVSGVCTEVVTSPYDRDHGLPQLGTEWDAITRQAGHIERACEYEGLDVVYLPAERAGEKIRLAGILDAREPLKAMEKILKDDDPHAKGVVQDERIPLLASGGVVTASLLQAHAADVSTLLGAGSNAIKNRINDVRLELANELRSAHKDLTHFKVRIGFEEQLHSDAGRVVDVLATSAKQAREWCADEVERYESVLEVMDCGRPTGSKISEIADEMGVRIDELKTVFALNETPRELAMSSRERNAGERTR